MIDDKSASVFHSPLIAAIT